MHHPPAGLQCGGQPPARRPSGQLPPLAVQIRPQLRRRVGGAQAALAPGHAGGSDRRGAGATAVRRQRDRHGRQHHTGIHRQRELVAHGSNPDRLGLHGNEIGCWIAKDVKEYEVSTGSPEAAEYQCWIPNSTSTFITSQCFSQVRKHKRRHYLVHLS